MNSLKTTSFTGRLTDAMDASKVKAIDISRATGVSRGSISKWVSGATKSILAEHAIVLAELLGVNIEWLILGKGPRKITDKNAVVIEKHLKPSDDKLLLQFNSLPIKARNDIREKVENLSEEYAAIYKELKELNE